MIASNGPGQRVDVDVPADYPMPDTMHLANGTYGFTIMSKYNLYSLTLGYNVFFDDLSSLKYCQNLNDLNYSQNANKTGNLSDLSELTGLKELYMYQTSVSGDISVLSNLILLTALWLYNNSHVSGTVESLVKGQSVAGRESGTFALRVAGTSCTFNSTTVQANTLTIAFSSTGATVSNGSTLLATYTKSNDTWVYE